VIRKRPTPRQTVHPGNSRRKASAAPQPMFFSSAARRASRRCLGSWAPGAAQKSDPRRCRRVSIPVEFPADADGLSNRRPSSIRWIRCRDTRCPACGQRRKRRFWHPQSQVLCRSSCWRPTAVPREWMWWNNSRDWQPVALQKYLFGIAPVNRTPHSSPARAWDACRTSCETL